MWASDHAHIPREPHSSSVPDATSLLQTQLQVNHIQHVSIDSTIHRGIDASIPKSQITATDPGSYANRRSEANSTVGVHFLNVLELLTRRTRLSNGPILRPPSPDVFLVVSIIVPLLCCCCCACFFLLDYRNLSGKFARHAKQTHWKSDMQARKWMVLIEDPVQQVKSFAFNDQAQALTFFNSCASFIARIMFEPLPDDTHAEVRVEGTNKFARDQIRVWSRTPAKELVPDVYNVLVYRNGPLFFPFKEEQSAQNFMARFEYSKTVLYDPQGNKVSFNPGAVGSGLLLIR